MTNLADIPSPCIGVCQLGSDKKCLGCLRTSDEILAWKSASMEEKLQILGLLKERRRQRGAVGKGEIRHRRRRKT